MAGPRVSFIRRSHNFNIILKTLPFVSAAAVVEEDGKEVKMAFKVMTRKGHKQQLKELHIPLDSDLASGLRDVRQAKLEEMREMKEKVLGYERRQEEEAYQGTLVVVVVVVVVVVIVLLLWMLLSLLLMLLLSLFCCC